MVESEKRIEDVLDVDFNNALVFVNGFQVNKDYELKEDDVCTVRCYPSAGVVVTAVTVYVMADAITASATGKHLHEHALDGIRAAGRWLFGIEDPSVPKSEYEQLRQVPTVKGSKNRSALNTPCPLVLGKSLYTPNYVGSPYTTISGEDGEDITYHALFRLGYNDINVRNVCLGMTDLASNSENKRNGFLTIDGQFSESEYGTKVELQQDGAEVSLYPQKVYQENLNIELINADGTALTVNRFSAMHPQIVELEFTINGLIGYNDEGSKESRSVSISLEESLDGGNTWRSFGQITGSNSYSESTSTITRQKAKVMRFVAKKTYSYEDAFNATNKTVEYRIKRTSKVATDDRTSDTVYLTAIRTWCYDNEKSKEAGSLVAQTPVIEKDRNKMARLGLEIKGGDAIQGTIEELNCVLSSNARTWNGTKWSDTTSETNNPASLALLAMQGKHRGNEIVKDSKIDLEQYGEFYDWCKENNYACNGVLLKQQKTQDVVKNILECGRAFLVLSGNKFGCLIDNDKRNVVMILNNQNVLEASNSKDFDVLPDGYRAKFYNENNYYQQDEMIVCYDGVDVNNPDLVLEPIELPYQTNPSQVYRYVRYSLACRKNRPEVWNRKVSIDGNLIEIGSLVEVQDDTILVGTGEGAEIKDVVIENGSVVSIVTDGQFEVVDIGKEYGVAITCANGIDEPRVIKRKVSIVREGIHNVFVFSVPLSLDNICPSIGDLVSFGEYEKITTEAICFGKKDNGEGTFDLTLIPYNAAVYNADIGEMPEFESKVTIPSKLPTEEIKLEPATKDDVNTQISGVLGGTLQVAPDSALSVKSAYVYQDYIEIVLSFSQNGSKNQVDKVYYRVDNGESANVFEANELTYRYYFDREKEGYKEADDFSLWKVSAKIKNVFGIETEWCENVFVDVSKYGTWKLGKPVIFSQVLDRSVFLTLSLSSRSDNKTVYGNIRYKVVIQRIGNKDIEGTEDYVEADTDWNKPATSASWQTSENNYKQGSAVTSYDDWLSCSSAYSQTLPLVGQTNKNSVATEYRYKVIAYNEAGYSVESDVISVTALPTNIADLVLSNENYKDLYVQRLSAISANVGLISQGGFGSFEKAENYWALSKLYPEETGLEKVIEKGAFRVGGKDQYIWVEPVVENGRVVDYTVSVKAGNFIITSLGTQINGELIVKKSDVSDERTRISPSGTYFERKVGSGWQTINRFDTSGVLSPSYKANNQILLGNFTQSQQRELGHDIGRPYLSGNGRVWHFDENFNSNDGTLSDLELVGEYDLYGSESSNGIDYTPAIKAVAPYCQIARCIAGNFAALKTIESTKTCTVDFWMQYIYAESQQLFSIGTIDDRIELNIQTEEPVYCVSGACSWRSQNGDILYTSSRNPTVGAKVYYDLGYAEEEINPLGEISTLITSESWLVDAFIFDGSTYYFENGNADYNWETFAPEDVWGETSVVYNRAAPGDVVLSHIGQSTRVDVPLKELNKAFEPYKWQHIGVVFTNNDIIFLFDDLQKVFPRNAVAENDIKVSLNTSKTKIIIDELYIDTAVEDVVNFFNNTIEKLPWGALSRSEDWFIFDAKDLTKVKSNILDKVKADVKAELLNSEEIKQLINDVINNN